MNNLTDKLAINENLIRALYAAKAEFKDAASDLATAENNLAHTLADASACAGDRNDARTVKVNAADRYAAAEKTYDLIWKLCRKFNLVG